MVNKRWPLRRWQALAQRARSAGLPVVALAAPWEQQLLDGLVRAGATGHAVEPVEGALSWLREARVVVAGDTGWLHLGGLSGARVVGLHGPTPLDGGYAAWAGELLSRDLPCQPCSLYGGARCRRVWAPRACLEGLDEEVVWRAVERQWNASS